MMQRLYQQPDLYTQRRQHTPRRQQHTIPILITMSIGLALLLAACETQTVPTAVPTPDVPPPTQIDGYFVLSDSAPLAGTMVTITAYAPHTGYRIGAYEAQLEFDTTRLQFIAGASMFDGSGDLHATNNVLRAAGANAHGSTDRRLFSAEFRVRHIGVLSSLKLSFTHLAVTDDDRGPPKPPKIIRNLVVGPFSRSEFPQYGDVDGDGSITASDGLILLQIAAGLMTPTASIAVIGDMNNDGKVSVADAQIVLSYIVGANVRRFRVGDRINAPDVRITSITPVLLRPGSQAVITGENFSSNIEDDTVLIDDVPAQVLAASPTQLTIRVPSTLQCEPTHAGSVLVRAGGGGGHRFHPLSAATAISIAVGETRLLGPNDNISCLEVPENAKYIVAVHNPVNTRMLAIPFNVIGATSQGQVPVPASATLPPRRPATVIAPPNPSVPQTSVFNLMRNALGRTAPGARLQARLHAHQIAHQQKMAREYTLLQQFKNRGTQPLPRGGPAVRAQSMIPAREDVKVSQSISPTVGAYSSIKIHDPDSYDTYTTVRARTAYVGTNCIVLEDSASALAGTIDSYYSRIGQEFDQIVFPMLQQNFGNPLAMDANTDANGRIVMLFSPVINQKYPHLSGFVTSCDFFSASVCPASNQAEIFYAEAPLNMAMDYSDESVSGWFWTIRSIIPHEAKHITSVAERLSRGGFPETTWLEEGTAQIASELYGRHFYGANATWKGNAVYAKTLYCELRPQSSACLDFPVIMFNHFGWLSDYAWNTDSFSPINSVSNTIYGSAWLLVRWAADAYAVNEAAFFRALTQQSTDTGLVNLTARVGLPWSQILGRWALAFAGDEVTVPGSNEATHQIASWNLPDIFQEMSRDADWSIPASPLRRTRITSGNFTTTRAAAGGSFAIFDLELNSDFKQTIGIVNTAGGSFPPNVPMSVAIWRIQ